MTTYILYPYYTRWLMSKMRIMKEFIEYLGWQTFMLLLYIFCSLFLASTCTSIKYETNARHFLWQHWRRCSDVFSGYSWTVGTFYQTISYYGIILVLRMYSYWTSWRPYKYEKLQLLCGGIFEDPWWLEYDTGFLYISGVYLQTQNMEFGAEKTS